MDLKLTLATKISIGIFLYINLIIGTLASDIGNIWVIPFSTLILSNCFLISSKSSPLSQFLLSSLVSVAGAIHNTSISSPGPTIPNL